MNLIFHRMTAEMWTMFFEEYAILSRQKSKFTLTDIRREWEPFRDRLLGQVTGRGGL